MRITRQGAYFKRGNFPELIKNYGELIELKPDHDEAHNVLGISYLKIGYLYNAIIYFTKAVSLNPLKVTDYCLTNLTKIKNPDFKKLNKYQQIFATSYCL